MDRSHVRKLLEGGSTFYRCHGKSWSARDFFLNHLEELSEFERGATSELTHHLDDNLPEMLAVPIAGEKWCATDPTPLTFLKKFGGRSGLALEQGIYLKACRPLEEPATFPTHTYSVEKNEVVDGDLPFGVLAVDGIMRALMGYLFQQAHGLTSPRKPVAVFEYRDHDGNNRDYCIAFDLLFPNTRVEEQLDYGDVTIDDLLALSAIEEVTGQALVPIDPLVGNDNYAEHKAKALLGFHFNGGFRGFLNSNIGNDIIVRDATGHPSEVALVDFDTFEMQPLPDKDDHKGKVIFYMNTHLELVKTSLATFAYLNVGEDSSEERILKLEAVYESQSPLFRLYQQGFLIETDQRGWGRDFVEEARSRMRLFPLYEEALSDLVSNSETFLASYAPEESVYLPQHVLETDA